MIVWIYNVCMAWILGNMLMFPPKTMVRSSPYPNATGDVNFHALALGWQTCILKKFIGDVMFQTNNPYQTFSICFSLYQYTKFLCFLLVVDTQCFNIFKDFYWIKWKIGGDRNWSAHTLKYISWMELILKDCNRMWAPLYPFIQRVKRGSTICVWYLLLWEQFTPERVENSRVISSLWVFIPGKGWSTTCVWYLFLWVWFIAERVDNPHVISSLWVLFPGGANFFWSRRLFHMGYLSFFHLIFFYEFIYKFLSPGGGGGG